MNILSGAQRSGVQVSSVGGAFICPKPQSLRLKHKHLAHQAREADGDPKQTASGKKNIVSKNKTRGVLVPMWPSFYVSQWKLRGTDGRSLCRITCDFAQLRGRLCRRCGAAFILWGFVLGYSTTRFEQICPFAWSQSDRILTSPQQRLMEIIFNLNANFVVFLKKNLKNCIRK